MTRVAILVLFVAFPSFHASPLQQRQQRQQKLQDERPRAALQRSVAEDAVYAFYVRQFQQDTEVAPEVFSKILPFIDQYVKDRFEISQRRVRALNQLRQAIERNGSEDELRRLIRELDAADSEFQANQEKFLTNVDPLLNLRQRAKVRILQTMAENRIRQSVNAVQNRQRQGAGSDRAQD
jgi:hypothetical protein